MASLPRMALLGLALALARYEVPGAAIALVQDGRLVLTEGFGVRDLDTGATTRAPTVAALVDRERLGWEQPMV